MADIIVTMNDNTQVTSREGFGKTLIFVTTKDFAFKEYDILEGLASLQKDFDVGTEVYKMAEVFSKANPTPEKLAVYGKDLSKSLTKEDDLKKELNTLSFTHPNWYRLLLEETKEEFIKAAASWVESASKILYVQLNKSTKKLNDALKGNKRVAIEYTDIKDDRKDVALSAYATSRVPGSFTFKFKPLIGCKPDALTPEEILELSKNNMNCYVTKFRVEGLGKAQLNSGLMASGDFIDHIESMDYIKFKVTLEIARILMQKEKVPFDNDGIQMIISCVRTALNDAFKDGIIRKRKDGTADIEITCPSIEEMNPSDVQARVLKGLKFKYGESGAIETVYTTGEVVTEI